MKFKIVLSLFLVLGVAGFAVANSSPHFFNEILTTVGSNPITKLFSPPASSVPSASSVLANDTIPKNVREVDVPEHILWSVVLSFPKKFEAAAEKAKAAEQDETPFTEYFTRQAKLSPENAEVFKQKGVNYAVELNPLTERFKEIENYGKAARERGQRLPKEEIETLSKELLGIQEKRKELALKYRDEFRNAIDANSYTNFENWLNTEFSAKFSSKKVTSKDIPSRNNPNERQPNNGFESFEGIQNGGIQK